MTYRALFDPDPAGGFVVTFPDFPYGVTQGETEASAMEMAEDAVLMILGHLMKQGEPLPAAKPARARQMRNVAIPALAAAKVELYQAFRASGLRKSDLAKRMGIALPNVDRLFSLQHASRLDQMEAAFRALGKRLAVVVEDAA
jgi:antitoxin HicB